jgi:hypothetical protein
MIKNNVYWAATVSIFSVLETGKLELLELNPIIILIVFFCNLKTLLMSVELPKNTMSYFIIEQSCT